MLLLQVCAATAWVRCGRNIALRFAGDEGEERELWIALLQLSSVRSLQAVSVLAQEQEMLAMMLRRQDTDVDSAQREAEGAHCRGSVTGQGDVRVPCVLLSCSSLHSKFRGGRRGGGGGGY